MAGKKDVNRINTIILDYIDNFYKKNINEKDYKAVAYKIINYIKRNSIPVNLSILYLYLSETYNRGIEDFYYNATPEELYVEDFIDWNKLMDKWFLFWSHTWDKKSTTEIAKLCRCDVDTILIWLNQY